MTRTVAPFIVAPEDYADTLDIIRGEIEFGIDADTKTALPGTG
jgi:hypothetical protein